MLNIDETFLKKEISSLSSGEKQRVTLARVLLQESDVLILDEALNQIEEKEEIRIIKEVMKLYQDKILIIISHRKNLIHLIPKIGIITKEGQIKYQKGENYV
jgi:ATP-binding cassette subfamily B protein